MMAAACSRHTFRFNDRQPAHSPNEWLVSTRIGFGAVAAAPAFSSAAAVHLGFASTNQVQMMQQGLKGDESHERYE